MLIRSIHLSPFAGVANGLFQFAAGLNVLLGPNEAGKSTLVSALRTVMLEPCNPNKRRWDQELSRFLPRGGGDTFRVEVEFDASGGSYRLSKQWGKQPRCQLRLPNDNLVEDVNEVESRLAALLVLKPGTWDHVLFAHQNALSGSLPKLTGNSPEKHELANLLRSAVMATDGVSLEKLEYKIDQGLKALLDRWDRTLQCPEGNRGLSNRWQKGVGSIATAWYRKEQAKQDVIALDNYERALTDIDQALLTQCKRCEELQAFVTQFEPIVKATVERRGIEASYQLVQTKEAALKEVSLQWPKYEERLVHKQSEVAQQLQRIDQLDREFKLAEKCALQQTSIERLQRVNKLKQQMDDCEAEYANLHPMSAEQWKTLDQLHARRDKLGIKLESSKLTVTVSILGNASLQVQCGLESLEELSESRNLQANGRFMLRHPDFEVQVISGDCNFEELESQLRTLRKQIDEKLAECRVSNLEQAREKYATSDSLAKQLKHLRESLAGELKGDSLEQLAARVGELLTPPNRELGAIQQELSNAQATHQGLQREIQELEGKLSYWKQQFQSMDGVLDQQIELRAQGKRYEVQLASLPRLPETLGSLEEFMETFERQQAELRTLRDQTIPALKDDKRNLGLGPEKSRADLEAERDFAESEFDQQVARLKALERIQQVYRATSAEMDSNTLNPWFDGLAGILQHLTTGSYQAIDTDTGMARRGSLELPFELLSMGTKACLGLALRLSMAQHFLQGQSGFLVLDDPLVDLDAERRKRVVELINDFAKSHQLIVFTCDTAHAELLGGQQIQVERVY